MIPTRTQVNNFKIARMGAAADQASRIGSAIDRAANLVRGTIAGLDWSGKARSAAVDRANREHVQLSRVSKAFDDLAQAITDGMTSMGFIAGELKSKADGLEQDMYEVTDTWEVKDTYNYELGYAVAEANDDDAAISRLNAIKAQRETARKAAEVQLKKLAGDFHTADTNCAAAVNAANATINALAPAASGLGTGSADTIMSRLNNGQKLTRTQLEQLRLGTSLTPQQRDALRKGKPAEMSQAQYDFLKELIGDLDGKSMDDIMKLGHESQRGEVQSSLANGTRILGVPNVRTRAGDQGGMAALPTSMRNLLVNNLVDNGTRSVRDTTKPVTAANVGLGWKTGDAPTDTTKATIGKNLESFFKFTQFMSQGDNDADLGSDVNRGILKQTAEISGAAATTNSAVDQSGQTYLKHGLDIALNQALNSAAGDKLAAHDFITGDNMNATCSDGGKYNAGTHLNGLFSQTFGTETSGLNKLFSWVGSDAASADPSQASLAHDAARDLGKYFGSAGDLQTNAALGAKNPEVSQMLARALSPYIGSFSGAEGLPGMPKWGIDGLDQGELNRLFQTFNSDPKSSQIFNGSAEAWKNYMSHLYSLHPDQPSFGRFAGHLDQAMHTGFEDEKNFLKNYKYNADVGEYRETSDAVSQVKSLMGEVPVLGKVMNFAPPSMIDSIVNGVVGEPPHLDRTKTGLEQIIIGNYIDPDVQKFHQFQTYAERHPELIKDHSEWFKNGEPVWNNVKDDPRWHSFMRLETGWGDWASEYREGAGDLEGHGTPKGKPENAPTTVPGASTTAPKPN